MVDFLPLVSYIWSWICNYRLRTPVVQLIIHSWREATLSTCMSYIQIHLTEGQIISNRRVRACSNIWGLALTFRRTTLIWTLSFNGCSQGAIATPILLSQHIVWIGFYVTVHTVWLRNLTQSIFALCEQYLSQNVGTDASVNTSKFVLDSLGPIKYELPCSRHPFYVRKTFLSSADYNKHTQKCGAATHITLCCWPWGKLIVNTNFM